MLRRDFVRAVVALGLAPRSLLSQQAGQTQPPLPAPVPWPTGFNPQTPVPRTDLADEIAQPEPTFFVPHQMATLSRLCDLLLPPIGNKPGALQAGTPLFLDFLIGASPTARQKMYTGGLEWLNEQALAKFKLTFAKLDSTQADAILKPWLRTWMSDHPPVEIHADFINIAHSDIRSATVNSKQWSEVPSVGAQEKTAATLYWEPIETPNGETARRPSLAQVRLTGKAAQAMPEYSR
jgi:hypothetical protein